MSSPFDPIQSLIPLLATPVALIGACIGSFINVVAWR